MDNDHLCNWKPHSIVANKQRELATRVATMLMIVFPSLLLSWEPEAELVACGGLNTGMGEGGGEGSVGPGMVEGEGGVGTGTGAGTGVGVGEGEGEGTGAGTSEDVGAGEGTVDGGVVVVVNKKDVLLKT